MTVDILSPIVLCGLLIGAMLPYVFSAITMRAVGMSANKMMVEVRRQLRKSESGLFSLIYHAALEPQTAVDAGECVRISTEAAFGEMIELNCIAILTPLAAGYFFGTRGLAAVLAGVIFSALQVSVSSIMSGGAWHNGKAWLESIVAHYAHPSRRPRIEPLASVQLCGSWRHNR